MKLFILVLFSLLLAGCTANQVKHWTSSFKPPISDVPSAFSDGGERGGDSGLTYDQANDASNQSNSPAAEAQDANH